MTSLDMDSRRSTAVQFFVEDDNNKVSCTSVASCMSEVTCRNVSVFSILVSFTKPRKMARTVTPPTSILDCCISFGERTPTILT